MTRPTEPCPFYGMPCEHVPMAHEAVRLRAEVDSLTAQLAEARAKAHDWQAMKDERDAAKIGYANLLDDTNGEIKGLRAQLAEREGIARELAEAIEIASANDVWTHVEAALARFHAAEADECPPG